MTELPPSADYLPPPPMSQPDLIPEDLVLPGSTPLLTGGAGALVGAGLVVLAGGGSFDLELILVGVLIAGSGYLIGLGAVTADRGLTHWPRYWRWALGMCLGGALPVVNVIELIQSNAKAPEVLVLVSTATLSSMVCCGLLGFTYGLQATLLRGLVFRFMVVGFWVSCLLSVVVWLPIEGLMNSMRAFDEPPLFVFVFWVLGPFIGLAFAVGLGSSARDREAF